MNKHIYRAGVSALALAMLAVPAMALAENGGGEDGIQAQVGIQARGTDASATGTVRVGESGDEENKVEEQKDRPMVANVGQDDDEAVGEDQDELELELEDDGDRAFSLDDLKQKIENRRLELDDEEASTTPENQGLMKNANPVRLAVHSLLASKDLLGGIGSQVSEIAKQMNDSVATTTNAEAKIQSRSLLARLFFGGDSAAADVISQAVAQNQQRIDDLTKLLEGANVSADIQIVLKAQITALQTAQARLQDLAQKEQKMWGLFSWRF
ncbi:MAG: hypothetical protein NUV90_02265 [Candidatus Parcubacteria bacterium]|nr:hypothetical protein [Candidatus Parcubacteria bacterium]